MSTDTAPTPGLLILSDMDIRTAVDAATAVRSQQQAFQAVSDGSIRLAGSTAATDESVDGLVFALTGAIAGQTGIACKFGYQVPGNSAHGLPPVHAFVTLLDPDTGVPLACLNGTTITTMRTAAGLVAAAQHLAPAIDGDDDVLAVLGSGVQARETALLMAATRPLTSIRVYSPSDRKDLLVADLQHQLPDCAVAAAASAEDAVRPATLVACCTASRTPVVQGGWLRPGSTILTMGSYQPDRSELDDECTRAASLVVVDDVAKASATCGPVVAALESGSLAPQHVRQLGDLMQTSVSVRASASDIVIFHSVGLGVQDAALGWTAYLRARELGLGTQIAGF